MNNEQGIGEAQVVQVNTGFSTWDRLTLIARHYFIKPLLGTGLRIFVPDHNADFFSHLSTATLLGLLVGSTIVSSTYDNRPLTLGLMLLVLCPQWLYAFTRIQHTIFEYRGALFAIGYVFLLIGIWTTAPLWMAIIALVVVGVVWYSELNKRLVIYSDPLLFWKQAHNDIPQDSTVASAYIYQLNKRERFGEVDDLYRWMTEARIPTCRSFLLNLAAAKFGPTTDSEDPATLLTREGLEDAYEILKSVTAQWPKDPDAWRNRGTLEYYRATMGANDYSMIAALTSFSKSIELDPKNSLGWLCSGHCYTYEGKWPNAVRCFRHAYNYMPTGAYLVEDISLIRYKLMEALQECLRQGIYKDGEHDLQEELTQHQVAWHQYQAYFVTEENARYIV